MKLFLSLMLTLIAPALLWLGASQQSPAPAAHLNARPAQERLEQERLAALPAIKFRLEELKYRVRADLLIIINEALFNKVLAELTETKFNAGGLFNVTIVNPHITIKNGLALAQMQAQLASTNSLLSINNSLNVTARLNLEQSDEEGQD